MKQRNLRKKVNVLLLTVVMMVALFPQSSVDVYAAELPDVSQFATAEQLRGFDTNGGDEDGEKDSAKLYFGKNNQQWWIAGSEDENTVTLFAASPLETDQQFATSENAIWYQDKIEELPCSYSDEDVGKVSGNLVYSSHYGFSPLRATLRTLDTYFTAAQQNLMEDSTVYTNDKKSGCTYSTSDKLYLAYGNYDTKKITVGENQPDSLDSGLPVDSAYWAQTRFWLRTPYEALNNYALVTLSSTLSIGNVTDKRALVPAFKLNLSSVLFASSVSISSSGEASQGYVLTLRYSGGGLGSAVVSGDGTSVQLTDVPTGTYLVAQNSEGVGVKSINGETSVSAEDMGLETFKNCKVWLETTNNEEGKTYATMAVIPDTEDMTVTFEEKGTYLLTIPTEVPLGSSIVYSELGVKEVNIAPEKQIYLKISSGLDDQGQVELLRENDSGTKIPVSVGQSEDTLGQLRNGSEIGTFTKDGTTKLYFNGISQKYPAGIYTGVIVFEAGFSDVVDLGSE